MTDQPTQSAQWQAMRQRLDLLEGSAARLRFTVAFLGVVCLLTAGGLVYTWLPSGGGGAADGAGSSKPGVLRATRFVVVDKDGNEQTSNDLWQARLISLEDTARQLRRDVKDLRSQAAKPAPATAKLGDVIAARRFELRDKKDRALAALAVSEKGTPELTFHSADNFRVAMLGMSEAGAPTFLLADPAGQPRIALAVMPNGTPRMLLMDEHGRERLSCTLDRTGQSHVVFFDVAGHGRGGLASPANGAPTFYVRGPMGKTRLTLGLAANESATLSLFDRGQIPRAELHVAAAGAPSLQLSDQGKNVRALLGMTSDGNTLLRMSDKQGKPTFSAP